MQNINLGELLQSERALRALPHATLDELIGQYPYAQLLYWLKIKKLVLEGEDESAWLEKASLHFFDRKHLFEAVAALRADSLGELHKDESVRQTQAEEESPMENTGEATQPEELLIDIQGKEEIGTVQGSEFDIDFNEEDLSEAGGSGDELKNPEIDEEPAQEQPETGKKEVGGIGDKEREKEVEAVRQTGEREYSEDDESEKREDRPETALPIQESRTQKLSSLEEGGGSDFISWLKGRSGPVKKIGQSGEAENAAGPDPQRDAVSKANRKAKEKKKYKRKRKKKKEKNRIRQLYKRSQQLDEDIVSEALAELLAEQGHRDKAIQMYEQLILKKPKKSAYFAGKINDLKNREEEE